MDKLKLIDFLSLDQQVEILKVEDWFKVLHWVGLETSPVRHFYYALVGAFEAWIYDRLMELKTPIESVDLTDETELTEEQRSLLKILDLIAKYYARIDHS